jgi:hypothetical protein
VAASTTSARSTINNSTISSNKAFVYDKGAYGGGISNSGTLTINNTTLQGNGAQGGLFCSGGFGGGIYNDSVGTLVVNNSTVSENGALFAGGIFINGGTATLQNSILENSGNCSGKISSNGYNLSSDDTCNFRNPGDLNNTDPILGPLQNNGGPTQTMALLPGSPAIDTGNPSGCTDGNAHLLKTDQRGRPRPDKEDTGGCDMGAYESQRD